MCPSTIMDSCRSWLSFHHQHGFWLFAGEISDSKALLWRSWCSELPKVFSYVKTPRRVTCCLNISNLSKQKISSLEASILVIFFPATPPVQLVVSLLPSFFGGLAFEYLFRYSWQAGPEWWQTLEWDEVRSYGNPLFHFLEIDIYQLNSTTLPETDIAPENRPSQKETSIPTIHFQVLC